MIPNGCAVPPHPPVEALGEALTSSGRPLVIASATVVLAPGRTGTEQDAPGLDPAHAGGPRARLAVEEAALSFAARGVRLSVVRLATTVHKKPAYARSGQRAVRKSLPFRTPTFYPERTGRLVAGRPFPSGGGRRSRRRAGESGCDRITSDGACIGGGAL
jgi:hypothetical protein